MSVRPARFARLRRDRSAVAAIEFALIAPVMGFLLLATLQFVNMVRIQSKLNLAAGQLAQMIAAQPSVTMGSADGPGGSLGDMCTAVSYNLLPYDPSKLSGLMESTTVVQPFGLQTAQDWAGDRSCPTYAGYGSFNETILLTNIADTPRSLFTLDGTPKGSGGQMVKGYSAISVQLSYIYQNVLPYPFSGSAITFTAVGSARPRSNTTIPCTYTSGTTSSACPGVY